VGRKWSCDPTPRPRKTCLASQGIAWYVWDHQSTSTPYKVKANLANTFRITPDVVTICNISFVFLCLPKPLIHSYLPLISISTFRRLHSHPLSLLLLDICSIPSSSCFTLTFPYYYPYLWHLSTLTDTPTYCRHRIDSSYVLPSPIEAYLRTTVHHVTLGFKYTVYPCLFSNSSAPPEFV
jgi:hypothetical protein